MHFTVVLLDSLWPCGPNGKWDVSIKGKALFRPVPGSVIFLSDFVFSGAGYENSYFTYGGSLLDETKKNETYWRPIGIKSKK